MQQVEVSVWLSLDDAQFLQMLAEARHCRIADLVEVAIETFIERHQAKHPVEGSSGGA